MVGSTFDVGDDTTGVLMEHWFISLDGNMNGSVAQGSLELINGVNFNVNVRSDRNLSL